MKSNPTFCNTSTNLCNIFGFYWLFHQIYYSDFVKISSATYHTLSKITAFLLLMAFLIPSGLHAKDFVEFCLMESETTEMAGHHDDCHPVSDEKPEQEPNKGSHPDCDWGFICACNIGQSQLGDEEWVPTHKDAEVVLTETGTITPFFTTGEHVQTDQQIRIGQYDPPLWLLYDTFLM